MAILLRLGAWPDSREPAGRHRGSSNDTPREAQAKAMAAAVLGIAAGAALGPFTLCHAAEPVR